jgi:hypothetical protein
MSETKHSDRYFQILQLNIDWLRFSETKATLILTVYGIMLTMVYTNSTSVFTSINNSCLILMLAFLYGLVSLASIGMAFWCINPKLKNKDPNSIIYFGHISKKFKTQAQYKTFAHLVLEDEDSYHDQLTGQIFSISKIAWKKYTCVTWSLRLFISSLILMVIMLFVYLVISL